MTIGKYCLFFLLGFCCGFRENVSAMCIYNRAANAVWVYDYAGLVPCRPRQLLRADKMNDWDIVAYNASNDTYTVNANLWIGRNNGTDTYFQLGGRENPHETLVVNGNLVIYPIVISGENEPKALRSVHRLRIGCPDHPDVRPRLLFDCGADGIYSLHAGAYYQGRRMVGGVPASGELHVYNGIISTTDPRYLIGRHLYLYLDRIVLRNATISRVARTIAYGLNAKNSLVENTVFEDSGNALSWGAQEMRGVTFRRLATAVSDSARYPLSATLTECRFNENKVNWDLVAGNLYLVDCEINPPLETNHYASRKDAVFGDRVKVRAEDVPDSVRVVSSRHVVVNVVDGKGQPVRNARVEAKCEQDDRVRRVAVTGAEGMTPVRGMEGALLLDEWEESAGMIADEPVRRDYSYTIEITPYRGKAVHAHTGLLPNKSWEIIEVNLSK